MLLLSYFFMPNVRCTGEQRSPAPATAVARDLPKGAAQVQSRRGAARVLSIWHGRASRLQDRGTDGGGGGRRH